MPRIPVGIILLLVISILVYFGVTQRVLDRLRLSDKAALAVIAAIIIGGFINIPLPGGARLEASLNVGGGAIPLALSGYLFMNTGTKERIRALLGIVITGFAVYLSGRFLGAEPENMFLDPMYVYPLVGGIVAYLVGRSRRSAFIAATTGIILVDVVMYLWLIFTNRPGAVMIGGGGAFDAVITAGLLAVLLSEFIGETREFLQGGPESAGKDPALLKNLQPIDERKEEKEHE